MDKNNELKVSCVVKIISNYVLNHEVAINDFNFLFDDVSSCVSKLLGEIEKPSDPVPFCSPNKSIHANYLICLEDGKKLKMLKRHLKTHYNLTPTEYRKRWNLPKDYPMVCPEYSSRRSELAKSNGLGIKLKKKK